MNMLRTVVICLHAVAVLAVNSNLKNPLNGRHLRVLTSEFPTIVMATRNATGHIVSANGTLVEILETISHMLNFSYHYLNTSITSFDDTPLERGASSYILKDEADFLLLIVVGLSYRYQIVDFPASVLSSPFGTLVPYPKENVNLTASYKSLSYQVWIAIVVSVCLFPLFLKLLSTWKPSKATRQNEMSLVSPSGWARYYDFAIGNLVSQGQFWPWRRVTTRIAAGAWCCACFFLVQIYCSTLISYLTTPNSKTVIDSFFDIPKTQGLALTLDKGLALDQMLKSTNSSFAKAIVHMLNDDPSLRCNVTSKCLVKVQTGTATYSSLHRVLKQITANDVKSTGTCHFTLLKETFWSNALFTPVPKKRPYLEFLSRAILRTKEAGLIDHWESWYVPNSDKCSKTESREKKLQRLSVKHLSSAFVLLGVGVTVSLIVFLVENLRFYFINK